ncbi:valine--pyruvate transaminase [Kordiimonas pumila]|uniref:Valine--pyruvate transaminase n=1 Tax=Kordiimonas pumila TaxID=2161677 RepID=A0ABV7D079_9PROT|nr:valine--pyruvate transaminase [Kordiimonas pumila]
MKLSAFGKKFTSPSGTVELMLDLGTALNENPDMIFMGGGNPGHIKEVEAAFQQRLEAILANPKQRHSLLGIYQSPQGDKEFRQQIAAFLNSQFNWGLTEHNIAVSNGSQSAFFILYNMFAGTMPDGRNTSIHLPLTPEYLGYADTGLSESFFTATKPNIELLDDALFKYRVDFSSLKLDASTAALCVSRPTNPTGNVLTDNEILHLDAMAKEQDIPFIIDGAYGLPFPNIMFTDATPYWNDNIILALSLSKLGLPGVRTGIVVAREDIIQAFTNANTIVNLACGTLGPALAKAMFKTGEILSLSEKYITPFYKDRASQTAKWFRESLEGLPFRIHKPEGAIFLWLWFEGLPITSQTLYERLKKRGVLIVPGHNFFVGLGDDWAHKHECIRVSYAQDPHIVQEGIRIIKEEVAKAYEEG